MLFRETTKDTLDLLVSLIPHVENIMQHDEIINLFVEQVDIDKNDIDYKKKAIKFVIRKIMKLLPTLLVDLREDILMILAKVNDTCIVDIEEQHPLVTIKQITDLITDEDLMGFLEQLM